VFDVGRTIDDDDAVAVEENELHSLDRAIYFTDP